METALEIEEAVEVIWEAVGAGRAPTPSAAVDLLWPIALSPEASEEALRYGLVSLANNRQHDARSGGRPAIAFGAPHGKGWEAYMETLSTPYTGADDNEKSLLDFTAEDLRAFESRCKGQAVSWIARGRVAKTAREHLAARGVGVLRDLPAASLEQIAKAWTEVWA